MVYAAVLSVLLLLTIPVGTPYASVYIVFVAPALAHKAVARTHARTPVEHRIGT